jgi:hypothetical protein
MVEKMINCKICGTLIAKSAKVCPHCGKKYGRPLWQIIIAVILIIIGLSWALSDGSKAVGSDYTASSNQSTKANEVIEIAEISSDDPYADYENNKNKDLPEVPSIEYFFRIRKIEINRGEIFAGKIVGIKYSEPDLFTDERTIESVCVGYDNVNVVIYNKNQLNINVGDIVFIKAVNGVILRPDSYSGLGSGEIISGNYRIKNSLAESEILPTLKDTLTIDEYFNDNVQYGRRRINLSGTIDSFSVVADGNLLISISSKAGKDILCYYDPNLWSKNNELRERLKTLKQNQYITMRGYFNIETTFTSVFTILEIIDFR